MCLGGSIIAVSTKPPAAAAGGLQALERMGGDAVEEPSAARADSWVARTAESGSDMCAAVACRRTSCSRRRRTFREGSAGRGSE